MSNQLKMATIQAILSLRAQRWSFRRIARELGVHRDTVARYVREAEAKPTKAPTGADVVRPPDQPPPDASAAALPPTRSVCEPWRDVILTKLASSLSAQRIYQDLAAEHGFGGSYYSVKRFVRKLTADAPLPFRRMECEPGQEAQVDFGKGAPIVGGDGRRRRTHLFRIVLSHSRKAYAEVTFRQTAEDFLRALENAFWQFGGVPKTLVIDNLKAAVLRADWFDPDLNPKLLSFAQHYGTVILPTRPRTPRHKGKTERGVGYAQDNGLKARQFASLQQQNEYLLHWETNIADQRIHGTTRQQVGRVFAAVERSTLLPLPQERFPCFQEARRIVSRDGHIEVAKAYYSAPPEYLGRTVWARWDARTVRIFNARLEQIALHLRHEPGRFSTLGEHLAPEKINSIERGALWLLTKAEGIGPGAHAWAVALLKTRGIEGLRTLQGMLALGKRHPCEALDRACQTALSYDAFRLRTVRQLLKRHAPEQQSLPLLDEHPIIRPLSDYGSWVRDALADPWGKNQRPQVLPPPPADAGVPPQLLPSLRSSSCSQETRS
jgi:transposase